jgi:hypothetical protein
MQSVLNESESETWTHIAPLLDGAMETLGRKDHDALVLRFFKGRNFPEVGAELGTGEDNARMRVNRALEKLHRYFSRRGISSTTAILAGAISTNSVQVGPAALAKSVQTQQTTPQTPKTCRKGTAMWMGLSIGVAVGAAVGAAIDNVAQGVAMGVAIGAAAGAAVTFALPKKV